MVFLIIIIFVGLAIAGTFLLARPKRGGIELLAAAFCIGLAGYAWQGEPAQKGAPKENAAAIANPNDEAIALRQAMGNKFSGSRDWLVIADAQSRQGKFANAAALLRNAVRENPKDVDLWLALGNALVGHGDGFISPAATFAFQEAANVSPEHPGPPFFMGLSLAQSGRLDDARTIWQELLDRSTQDAPWRPDLEERLARLDAALGVQSAEPTSSPNQTPVPQTEQ
jgi:cytochrome c-type biogenesis protein CcmH